MKISNILLAVILGIGLIGNAVAGLDDGLVAYYPFDGNANDESGHGNDGTEYGALTYSTGVVGQAVSFDGIDDYVDFHSNLNLMGFPLTVSYWINIYG